MFRYFFLVALLAFCLPARTQDAPPQKESPKASETSRFKSGLLVSFSVSPEKPAILSPYGRQRGSSPFWAEVVIKPDPGRSVSIHDYVLTADGREFPCAAVAAEGSSYSGGVWKLDKMDGSVNCRLLFAVPSADADYRLKFKLAPTLLKPLKLSGTGRSAPAGQEEKH